MNAAGCYKVLNERNRCVQNLQLKSQTGGSILLTKTTAAQTEVALTYHKVRGLYFMAVVFATTIILTHKGSERHVCKVKPLWLKAQNFIYLRRNFTTGALSTITLNIHLLLADTDRELELFQNYNFIYNSTNVRPNGKVKATRTVWL